MPNTASHCIPVIAGPTAAGKTEISLQVATRMGAEIISADSRQIYRGLDIGTAKPRNEDLAAVRHHFIDECDPSESFSAGAFARLAWQRIEEIRARGRRVVVCGGSTLYLEALVHGIADIPDEDPGIRMRLAERLSKEGKEVLFEELVRVDPEAAARLDPSKTSRLLRALSVHESTGRPLSAHWRETRRPPFDFRLYVVSRPRDVLYGRINRRVDTMIGRGLVDEVRALLDAQGAAHFPTVQTIGYAEIAGFLAGEASLDEAIRLIKRNTRRYAKRQLTWFRRWEDASWIEADSPQEQHTVVDRISRC